MVMRQRVDGRVHSRLIEISLRSIGIGPMEDQDNLAKLRDVAEQLESELGELEGVTSVHLAGSLRRSVELSDDVDLVVDPAARRLVGNPAHGGEWLLDLM